MGDLSRWLSDLALRSMKTLEIPVIQKVMHIIESSMPLPILEAFENWDVCLECLYKGHPNHMVVSGKEIPAFLVFL